MAGGRFDGSITIRAPVLATAKYVKNFPKREIFPGARETFSNLVFQKRAMWNYYDSDFELRMPLIDLLAFFYSGLMRDVRIYNRGGRGLWEGFVYEMALHLGVADIKITLESVWNRFWVRYRDIGGSTDNRTAIINDTVSQGIIGYKEQVLACGEQASAAIAGQPATVLLGLVSRPRAMIDQLVLGRSLDTNYDFFLSVKAVGYWKTLGWRRFNQTASSGTQSVSQEIADIVAAGAQYVASTKIDANTTAVSKTNDMDRTYEDLIKTCVNLGDSSGNRWLARWEWGRRLRVKQAAPATPPPATP